jgi:hypothetical protein
MIEYFGTYNLFAYGFYGSIIGMIYFVAICLASTMPYTKKPVSKVFEILLPVYFIGFILTFIGFPGISSGIIVIITYLIAMKKYMEIKTRDWLPIAISFFVIIGIFSITPPIFLNLIFGALCFYLFIQGKVKMYSINKQILANTITTTN